LAKINTADKDEINLVTPDLRKTFHVPFFEDLLPLQENKIYNAYVPSIAARKSTVTPTTFFVVGDAKHP
jgi:hypothetical protein